LTILACPGAIGNVGKVEVMTDMASDTAATDDKIVVQIFVGLRYLSHGSSPLFAANLAQLGAAFK
jgi:hypothetical protein